MKIITAAFLFLIVVVAVFTSWVQARWPVSVPEIAIFALLAGWCLVGLAGRIPLQISFGLIPLAMILVWGAIQWALGVSVYEWRTKVALLYWGCNLATFFIALQASTNARIRAGLLQWLVWLGVFLSLIGPIQEFYGGGKVLFLFDTDPAHFPQFGPFPYRNQYAAFVELVLPVALYRAFTSEHRRTLHVFSAAVLYASVIAASSRMGFLLATAEMIGVPLILLLRGRLRIRSLRNSALLFGALFAMLVIAAGPSQMLAKFRSPDPYAGRREYTEASFRMIADRPLMGFGLGTWSTAYPGYALFDDGLVVNQAHDDWVQWTAEGGLPLLAIMLGLAIWAAPRAIKSVWGAGVVAIFAHSLVDYPIQRPSVALPMFIMLAAIAAKDLDGTA